MDPNTPSWTAMAVARSRALHMILDEPPWVYEDSVAASLCDLHQQISDGFDPWAYAGTSFSRTRAIFLVREVICEELLAKALKTSQAQYVILGSGLNGFAYGNSPLVGRVPVFEVDHPVTQSWKRERLVASGLGEPDLVTFVPVDFETESLSARLMENGFDPNVPAVISWNGVTQYLDDKTILAALSDLIKILAVGSVVATQICLPLSSVGTESQRELERVMALAAKHGETWINAHTPAMFEDLLGKAGFSQTMTVSAADANTTYLQGRKDGLSIAEYFAMSIGRVA